MDFSTRQIARHLTLMDHDHWCSIPIEEFYHKAFEKGDKDVRTPNLQKYIRRFNDVTNWVVATVLQAQRKKDRVNVIVKFIRIMYELKLIKNFNGMMAIFGALNMIPIQKLKKTWKDLPKKANDMLKAVGDILPSTGNMKAYREIIRDAAPPALPFSGFMLTDLIYAEEMQTFASTTDIRALDDFASLSPRSASSDSSESPAPPASPHTPHTPRAASSSPPAAAAPIAAGAGEASASPAASPRGDSDQKSASYINWKKMSQISNVFSDVVRFQRTRFPFLEVKEIAEFVSDLSKHSWILTEDEMMDMANRLEGNEEPNRDASPNSIKEAKKKAAGKKTMVPAQFEDIGRDPNVFHEFAKHLRSRFNEENLLFWDACSKFRSGEYKDAAEKKKKAQEVFSKFVSGDSFDGQFVVGLDSALVRILRKDLSAADTDVSLFDKAMQTVEFSVLRPSFNEFQPTAPLTASSGSTRRESAPNAFQRQNSTTGSIGDSPSKTVSKKTLTTKPSFAEPPSPLTKKDRGQSRKDMFGSGDENKARVFEELQRDSSMLKAFLPFLEARFAGENLVFWEAVYKYKWLIDHDDKTEAKARAQEIYAKYVTGDLEDGKFAVGFSNPVAKDLKRRLDKGELTQSLFDTAMTEVEQISLRPAFADFIKTYKP